MRHSIIIYLLLNLLFFPYCFSQVIIGSLESPHESAVLELKSSDKGFLGPRVSLKSLTSPEPIENPAKGLLVINTADSGTGDDAVKGGLFYYWTGSQWIEFITESYLNNYLTESIGKLGIPRSAVFNLNGDKIINTDAPDVKGMVDMLKGLLVGERVNIPLRETINETGGDITLIGDDPGENLPYRIKFKPGTYSIIFVYQFIPANKAAQSPSIPPPCAVSSYFMDFPPNKSDFNNRDRIRIHNNSHHQPGINSFHGNFISYATRLEKETEWEVFLGAGQSGNCVDSDIRAVGGYAMANDNTFLYISRIGD